MAGSRTRGPGPLAAPRHGSQRQLADPVDGFHQLWTFAATTALVSGVIGSFIPRPTRSEATDAADLAPEIIAVEADVLPLGIDP